MKAVVAFLDSYGLANTSGDKHEKRRAALALARAELETLRAAEQVCLMVGWTAVQESERGKALYELWAEWSAAYKMAGGSTAARKHPELSNKRIRELAARRDATVAETLARFTER